MKVRVASAESLSAFIHQQVKASGGQYAGLIGYVADAKYVYGVVRFRVSIPNGPNRFLRTAWVDAAPWQRTDEIRFHCERCNQSYEHDVNAIGCPRCVALRSAPAATEGR